MSQHNKDLVRRVIDEIWTGRNLALVDALYTEDFHCHAEPADDWVGREDVRRWVNRMHEMFAGFEERVEELVAEGDKVVARTTLSGVARGAGGPGGGGADRPVSSLGILIYRIAEGRIAEQWEVANAAGIMSQLGLLPDLSGS